MTKREGRPRSRPTSRLTAKRVKKMALAKWRSCAAARSSIDGGTFRAVTQGRPYGVSILSGGSLQGRHGERCDLTRFASKLKHSSDNASPLRGRGNGPAEFARVSVRE